MKTEHTPGPWINIPMQDTVWAEDGNLQVAKISELPWINGKSNWVQEGANARLIAAAPELLEALKDLAKDFESLRRSCKESCAGPSETLLQARAAITKAKGTTP